MKDLKRGLSSATCLLLGTGTIPSAQAGDTEGWDFDTSVLYYSEADARVQAIEPVIDAKKTFADGQELAAKLTLDVLTGATPNGATPSNTPQTFTRPSGNDSYIVDAGKSPLDDTFHDTRIAVNGSWKKPLNRLTLLTTGVNFSREFDFLSYGASAQIAKDFNQKNTTLMFGVSTEFDSLNPVGGKPIPFAVMAPAGTTQPKQGTSDSKTVMDAILGVTQVVNRKTLMQVNYSVSQNSGYLNDPYKLLSRVNPATGAPVDYVYENRPDSRMKHALYWLTRYHLDRDVVSASYRYFFDDWGVKSHTVDLNYHWKYSARHYLEPRVRFYSQTEADFYKVHLLSGDPVPAEATADYRLATFNGLTYGLKWGWNMKNESAFIFRLEYYTTVGEDSPDEAIGVQRGLDMYPDTKALIAQIQYQF